LHRCGPAGLARLRADGARLQRLIEGGEGYVDWLVGLNADYRRLNLTMGGVADCMAVTLAMDECLPRAASG
jgi:triphosphoribosyl-dephospho-CoA synthase